MKQNSFGEKRRFSPVRRSNGGNEDFHKVCGVRVLRAANKWKRGRV